MTYFKIKALQWEIQMNRRKMFKLENKSKRAYGDKLNDINMEILELNARNLEILDEIEDLDKLASN